MLDLQHKLPTFLRWNVSFRLSFQVQSIPRHEKFSVSILHSDIFSFYWFILFSLLLQFFWHEIHNFVFKNTTVIFTVLSYFSEMMNWWKRWWRTREGPKDRAATTRWEKDYNLLECDRMALFDEYLEMGAYIFPFGLNNFQ